jgi:hypothetical protein
MNIRDITPEQRRRIAELAKTTEGSLRHVQFGRRQASAEMAIRIEAAAAKCGLKIKRESLCAACGGCTLARAARRKSAELEDLR